MCWRISKYDTRCHDSLKLVFETTDDINDVEDVKKKWSCLNMMTSSTNCPTLEDVLRTDEELLHAQKFIKRIVKKWDTSMNLYTHNCQHFSGFVRELLKNEEICPI